MRDTPETNDMLVSDQNIVCLPNIYLHCVHFTDHVGSLEVACNRIMIYNRKDHFS